MSSRPELSAARSVRERYDFFDQRRDRNEPFDEGDVQNVHAWMRAVTEWVEDVDARVESVARKARQTAYETDPLNSVG